MARMDAMNKALSKSIPGMLFFVSGYVLAFGIVLLIDPGVAMALGAWTIVVSAACLGSGIILRRDNG